MDGSFEPSREFNVGHGVDILGHVVSIPREVGLAEEVTGVVKAAAAVLGERVEVEGVIYGLSELAVFEDLAAEPRVEGVEERRPVGLAVDLRVEGGDVLFRGERRGCSLGCRSWESVEMDVVISVFVG